MTTRAQNEKKFRNWEDLPGGGRRYWLDVLEFPGTVYSIRRRQRKHSIGIGHRDQLVGRRFRIFVPHFQQLFRDRSGFAVADSLAVPLHYRRHFDRAADQHHLGGLASFISGSYPLANRAFLGQKTIGQAGFS